jgi:PAS domain S-box-containing protein
MARARAEPSLPKGPRASTIAFFTSLSAWPAAAYGALVIWAAGDFAASHTLWIFGWPFFLELLAASLLHRLAVGAGERWGVGPFVPNINAFDHVAEPGLPRDARAAHLERSLRAAERFPIWNVAIGLGLSAVVVIMSATLEWLAAGANPANTWVIVRGGCYAVALYGVASLALGEWLTRPICRGLRLRTAAVGVERYGDVTLNRAGRIAVMLVPTLTALLVAVEIGSSPQAGGYAYGTLIALSAFVVTALNLLQYENARSAVREIRDACRELAAGRAGGLVTGSIESALQHLARDFTEAAERVAARHRAVFDAALDGIVTVDAMGRILEVNPAAERTFGCSQAQMADRSINDIVPGILSDPEGLARGVITDTPTFGSRFERQGRRADGTTFPAEIAVTRIARRGDFLLTVHLRDITARKLAAERLSRSQRELQEHAEITAALLRIGATINVKLHQPELLTEVSRLTVEALACDASTIFVADRERQSYALRANVGSLPEIVSEIQQVEFSRDFPLIRILAAQGRVELADAARAPDVLPSILAERWRIGSLLAVPIVRREEILGVLIATYRDRTGEFSSKQRKLALGVAHATAIALENANLITDLQAASRLKTEFVSTMSHELRTPLNVILGFCEMARDPDVSPADRALLLGRIDLAGRTLLELVEGTLEIGKLEAGLDEPKFETVELVALWEKLALEHAVRPRGGDVQLIWDPAIPGAVVSADSRRLAMVIRNLVGNALKFTERGTVRVTMVVESESVVLRVADTGVGIAPADQAKIFDMFRQADGSDSRRHGGSGLGLYLVRRFAEQYRGSVELRSAVGRGSVFTVRLPRLVAFEKQNGSITAPAA